MVQSDINVLRLFFDALPIRKIVMTHRDVTFTYHRSVPHLRKENKNMKNKTIGFIAGAAVVLAIMLAGKIDKAQMDAYAAANDCTWQATGTLYGDDRDFICK